MPRSCHNKPHVCQSERKCGLMGQHTVYCCLYLFSRGRRDSVHEGCPSCVRGWKCRPSHGFGLEGPSSAFCQQCDLGHIAWLFLCVLSFSFLYICLICLVTFGCAGLVAACGLSLSWKELSGAALQTRCSGFWSWLVLLWSRASRQAGFSGCSSRFLERGLSSCGTQALLLWGAWDLHRPGIRVASSALQGGLLTLDP